MHRESKNHLKSYNTNNSEQREEKIKVKATNLTKIIKTPKTLFYRRQIHLYDFLFFFFLSFHETGCSPSFKMTAVNFQKRPAMRCSFTSAKPDRIKYAAVEILMLKMAVISHTREHVH